MSTLGERLKALRTTWGLNQLEVADFLGIKRSAYCCYEIGRIKPDLKSFVLLSELFKVSAGYLLFGDEKAEEEFIKYQANASKPRFIFDETLFTLSPRERSLILQLRILPNQEKFIELIHQECVEYIKGEN